MTKSGYFSNSAKFMAVVSALLLVANGVTAFSSESALAARFSGSLSSFALWVGMFLGFIAFNGEALGHKYRRSLRGKNATRILKLLLIGAFVYHYLKGVPEGLVVKLGTESVFAVPVRIFMSVLTVASSYGFMICMTSLWYAVRDKEIKRLFIFEILSFGIGAVYNTYKIFGYGVEKYNLRFLSFFEFSSDVQNFLCILSFLFALLMFIAVAKHYEKESAKEEKLASENMKAYKPARSVYSDEGFGLDNLEDFVLL